jgi:lipoate---protein ligase
MPGRVALAREVERPVLVLGSTQPTELVDGPAMRGRGIELARRRGGGGAVYLEPGAQLWVDAWVPRDDPLWILDVSAAAEWVGRWWMDALGGFGLSGFSVHAGRAAPGELGDLVCFAGRGPGEMFHGARKVVGLSQWRAREGALFSSCAYVRWNPVRLLELIYAAAHVREGMERELTSVAVGLAELDPPVTDLGDVRDRLIGSFPAFA